MIIIFQTLNKLCNQNEFIDVNNVCNCENGYSLQNNQCAKDNSQFKTISLLNIKLTRLPINSKNSILCYYQERLHPEQVIYDNFDFVQCNNVKERTQVSLFKYSENVLFNIKLDSELTLYNDTSFYGIICGQQKQFYFQDVSLNLKLLINDNIEEVLIITTFVKKVEIYQSSITFNHNNSIIEYSGIIVYTNNTYIIDLIYKANIINMGDSCGLHKFVSYVFISNSTLDVVINNFKQNISMVAGMIMFVENSTQFQSTIIKINIASQQCSVGGIFSYISLSNMYSDLILQNIQLDVKLSSKFNAIGSIGAFINKNCLIQLINVIICGNIEGNNHIKDQLNENIQQAGKLFGKINIENVQFYVNNLNIKELTCNDDIKLLCGNGWCEDIFGKNVTQQ